MRRFRLVPTFGQSTIRKFSNNASEMKKLAARNYEDMLQVRLQTFGAQSLTHVTLYSVRFLFLMGSFLLFITRLSLRFYIG